MEMDRIVQKQMAEKLRKASKDKINRNIKDSVFCDMFGQPEYLFQLYQALHPEDTKTMQDDLTIVTLSRVLSREVYNDLGFMAGNRLIVLVEAQSTWSENIVVRFLIYLGETYHRYTKLNKLNIYGSKKVDLPKPELYVVYTGEQKDRPGRISLKHSFFDTDECCIEIEAKVICDSKAGDILNQFITFSKVFDTQRKLYPGDPAKAVRETIRICREKDVLAAYLEKEEAAAVMFTIADEKLAYDLALKEEKAEAKAEGLEEGRAEGRAEGLAEGMAEGRAEGEIIGTIRFCHDELDLPTSQIVEKIMARFSLESKEAEKYVMETLNLQVT